MGRGTPFAALLKLRPHNAHLNISLRLHAQPTTQRIMTLSHSTPSSEAARIPLRSFATNFLLSAVVAAIPRLFQYFGGPQLKDIMVLISYNATILCVLAIYSLWIDSSRKEAFLPKEIHSALFTHLIAALNIITIFIGRHQGDPVSGFTTRQHIAVHFCLVFFVITEFEFYRAYILFRKFDTYTDCFKHFLEANVDPLFPYRRDPMWYTTDLPSSWRRYLLNGENEARSPLAMALSKAYVFIVALYFQALYLLFHVVCGLANYLIKRAINPDPEYNLQGAMLGVMVFFGTYPASAPGLYLGMLLLRVVRQANYVGVWAVVGLVARWRAERGRVSMESEDEPQSGHNGSANCGKRHTLGKQFV